MKEVISISLGPGAKDYAFEAELLGERVRVRRFGADGDTRRATNLIRDFDGHCDAIGLGGMGGAFRIGKTTYLHKESESVLATAKKSRITDGRALKSLFERNAVRDTNIRLSG